MLQKLYVHILKVLMGRGILTQGQYNSAEWHENHPYLSRYEFFLLWLAGQVYDALMQRRETLKLVETVDSALEIDFYQWQEIAQGLVEEKYGKELSQEYIEFVCVCENTEELWYANSRFFVESLVELGIITPPPVKVFEY